MWLSLVVLLRKSFGRYVIKEWLTKNFQRRDYGEHNQNHYNGRSVSDKNGGKIYFFDFLSIRLVLSIFDKKFHLLITNQFCPESQKKPILYKIQFWTTFTNTV